MLLLCHFSRVRLCATPQRAAYQAPLSLGFSRQEHWSGLPFSSSVHESEKWKMKVKSLGHVQLFATPWAAAYQAPPSMGFSRQEYWSGVPSPSRPIALDIASIRSKLLLTSNPNQRSEAKTKKKQKTPILSNRGKNQRTINSVLEATYRWC